MLDIKIDPHTHTIFTKHAFSTISENAQAAARKGLAGIGMTDHFGLLIPHFKDKREYQPENHIKPTNLPSTMHGVRVYKGVEIDIIGFDGQLAGSELDCRGYLGFDNFADYLLSTKELIIAALHYFHGFKDGNIAKNTQMYIDVVSRKGIDILGHPARAGLEFDILEVVRIAKLHNTLIEINTEDFVSRPQSIPIFKKIAETCALEAVPIVLSSDAHFCLNIGEFGPARQMLIDIGFPRMLIANRNTEAFEAALRASGRQL